MDLAPFLNRVDVTPLSLTIQRSQETRTFIYSSNLGGIKGIIFYATVLNVTIRLVS